MQKKKCSLSDSDVSPTKTPRAASKHDQCAMKVQEVEKIVQKLKEKHQSKFSIEKLNARAHIIQLETFFCRVVRVRKHFLIASINS